MIEVEHLTKTYNGRVNAVDDLSFTVEKGQIYGFLGPNGAGKSTTMNIITGYISATSGKVTVDGHDIFTEPKAAKRCIGYLPELPPLYTDLTPREYLNIAAGLKNVPKAERRTQIEEIMEMTGIQDVSERLIRHLSKGYRQRVGLAQAMIGYPDILILDEPTVGLDPKQIIEMRELIRSLRERHTVILSSHILSEVSAVCDTVLILSHGRLVASDTPENLSRRLSARNTLLLTAAVLAVTLVLGVLVDRIVLRPQGEPFADAEAMQAFLADAEQEGYASSILSVDAERHTVYLREEMLSVRARRASSREFFAAAMLMEMAYAFWRGRKLLREDEKPGGRS